ncbi:hypothetical protein [Paractinoplanes durhamensis]|uniref:Uncharacterized protein n=1 Tax=Paractinoplanes durhamensis TaxID=113563 RepID=A0ABQ3ZE69_9ACTN|nr:hypothetical protein [Actinoplanes durhamensis]GIE08139.1 hypothetical protein Adu01nite_94890 [Actinoplanes durhamensis]
MNLIWATRGLTWGFRFLLDGGFTDPLPQYEAAFSGTGDDSEICYRTGERVALRFPDPLARKDAAGRVIPHEFVVFGHLVEQIQSLEDGRHIIWNQPGVADQFEKIWDSPHPPPAHGS